MNEHDLKEYRILRPIPGVENQVDSFLKEKFTIEEDGSVEIFVNVVHIDMDPRWSDGEGYIAVREWFLTREELQLLCDCGVLEEYEDKFLS